jgi:hypothetical protein
LYVRYPDQTWTEIRSSSGGNGPSAKPYSLCGAARVGGLGNEDPALLMKGAASLVTCPYVKVTRGLPIGGAGAITVATPRWGITMWLNAVTYLPIQVVSVHPHGHPADIVQYGYLPPTPANLRLLSVVIPRGFTDQPPGSEMPKTTTVPVQPWAPPKGVIPPFTLQPVPAPDSLTAAQAKGDILWARTTTQAVPASDTLVDTVFRYKSASRDLTYYPDGRPWDDDSSATFRGADGKLTSTRTVVLYTSRTAGVDTSAGSSTSVGILGPSCANVRTVGLSANFTATPDAARALLGCKTVTITRGVRIGGVAAIKIAEGDEALWINAATYLPIQEVITNPKGQWPPAGYHNSPSPGQVIQYTYLPPTPANLAYLAAPVPPGFRHAG